MAEIDVWVAYADDHDYDAMSQWLVGVYMTEAEAEQAVAIDEKRYVSEGGYRGKYNFEITKTILRGIDG